MIASNPDERTGRDTGPDSGDGHSRGAEVTADLPMSLTAFVGRERELDELRSLFRAGKRLVTLIGTGGIGKTRLAVELGRSASDLGEHVLGAARRVAEVLLRRCPSVTEQEIDELVAVEPHEHGSRRAA
jgi:hypothetical protein